MEQLAEDKLELIAKIVRNDRKFSGNEDLYEDFFNETCKRSFLIARSVKSEATLATYVRRIASTAIINVLKDSGRLRRTREGYVPTCEEPLEKPVTEDFSQVVVRYEPVDNADTPEDVVIKQEILRHLMDALCKVEQAEPQKKFLQLFKLRYDEGMTQREIAQTLSISQSEVSKRLFRLMEKIKQNFN